MLTVNLKGFILQNKLIVIFVTVALLAFAGGFASFQIHESNVKREILAAKIKAEKEKAEREAKINQQWQTLKYARWQTLGDFSYDFPGGKCPTSLPCTRFTMATKYNCSSVNIILNWIGTDGSVIEKNTKTEDAISSLESREVYFQMSKSAKIKFVQLLKLECVDKVI